MIATQTVRVIDPRGLRVRVIAGQPVPAHLQAAYRGATERSAPVVVPDTPEPDGLEALKRPELLKLAGETGVPGRGTNAELIAAIRAAQK